MPTASSRGSTPRRADPPEVGRGLARAVPRRAVREQWTRACIAVSYGRQGRQESEDRAVTS